MRSKTKKATFNLHTDVLDEIDEVVAQGKMASKNALVEQAIINELKELRRQSRQARWKVGATDPLLIKDVAETEEIYKSADAESARIIR